MSLSCFPATVVVCGDCWGHLDRNPSVTMMNLVEELLAPDDVPAYVAVLMDKVKTDRYPSFSMLRRLMALAS